jgi:hypothetical protein
VHDEPLWLDEQIAARIRAHMPDESPIDLDEHAARIGRAIAYRELEVALNPRKPEYEEPFATWR